MSEEIKNELERVPNEVYEQVKELNRTDDDVSKMLSTPTISREECNEVEEFYSTMSESESKNLSQEQIDAIFTLISTNKLSAMPKDTFKKLIDDNKLSNKYIEAKDKYDYSCKPLGVNTSKLKGDVSGKKAMLAFSKGLGLNNNIRINLYNSGFVCILGRVEQTDIVDLITNLAVRKNELGKNTHGLVYSNETIIFTKIIIDFMIDHLEYCTLKSDDIRQHILMSDIFVIFSSIMQAIFPKGVNIVRNCSNAIIDEDTKKLKCDFILKARVKPVNTIQYDLFRLSDFHRQTLRVTERETITEEIVTSYQKTLKENAVIAYPLPDDDDGYKQYIYLQTPNIPTAIDNGEAWIEQISDKTNDILANIEEDDEIRVQTIDRISKTTLLNRYHYYVKKIEKIVKDDDGNENTITVTDTETIRDILNMFVDSDELYNAVMKAYEKHISDSQISMIGFPNYKCPKCKEEQVEKEDVFKSIIPFNPYWGFLEVCTLKYQEIVQRTTSNQA